MANGCQSASYTKEPLPQAPPDRASWFSTTKMADIADSTIVGLDVELLAPPAAGRLSPALPTGEQLLDANLYAVCELVAGRAARASSARQYRAIYTRFCDALRLSLIHI